MKRIEVEAMISTTNFNINRLKNERIGNALGDENFQVDKAITAMNAALSSLEDYREELSE